MKDWDIWQKIALVFFGLLFVGILYGAHITEGEQPLTYILMAAAGFLVYKIVRRG